MVEISHKEEIGTGRNQKAQDAAVLQQLIFWDRDMNAKTFFPSYILFISKVSLKWVPGSYLQINGKIILTKRIYQSYFDTVCSASQVLSYWSCGSGNKQCPCQAFDCSISFFGLVWWVWLQTMSMSRVRLLYFFLWFSLVSLAVNNVHVKR